MSLPSRTLSPSCTKIRLCSISNFRPLLCAASFSNFHCSRVLEKCRNTLGKLGATDVSNSRANQSISSRISLISKSDIRYVGTLVEINSEKSTVALEDVRSFGTEGRRSGEDEILPSATPFDYIIFRGSDVKDLRIEEAPKETKPAPPPVPNDPAILGVSRTIYTFPSATTMNHFGCKTP